MSAEIIFEVDDVVDVWAVVDSRGKDSNINNFTFVLNGATFAFSSVTIGIIVSVLL